MFENVTKKQWVKFAIYATIYLLWLIWLNNYWLLPGLLVIFDIYISKKVPWTFWKKDKGGKDDKKSKSWVEWIDALVYALIVVSLINIFLFQNYKIPTSSLEKSLLVGDHLFVSKLSYGPRVPNTPLALPLMQNTIPIFNSNSYLEWPNWEYKRLKGFGNVEREDIVVFNFPAGDTVPKFSVNPDYYIQSRNQGIKICNYDTTLLKGKNFSSEWELNEFYRSIGKGFIKKHPEAYGEVVYRPVDRRDNYVKRCVALPGDHFEIKHNRVYINGKASEVPEGVQHWYNIVTDGTSLNRDFLDKYEISREDASYMGFAPNYRLPLTAKLAAKFKEFKFIKSITVSEEIADNSRPPLTWPYSRDYKWSRDNFGPLNIPKKGATVELTLKNLVLYDRIIRAYEHNTLEVKNGKIFINNKETTSYTFKMDYYFMMGDNRHQSADSRYWGFVPEDHIVGKPILVWLSLNKDKSFFDGKIRFNRFFKWVSNL